MTHTEGPSIQVAGYKASITKSRSGHYTLTIREQGTWSVDGNTYALNRVVARHRKIDLAQAQQLAAQYKGA